MFINDVHKGYMTELGEIDGIQTVAILNDQLVYYAFTKDNVFEQQVDKHTIDVFIFKGRYSSDTCLVCWRTPIQGFTQDRPKSLT
jgi:hypothetical protein